MTSTLLLCPSMVALSWSSELFKLSIHLAKYRKSISCSSPCVASDGSVCLCDLWESTIDVDVDAKVSPCASPLLALSDSRRTKVPSSNLCITLIVTSGWDEWTACDSGPELGWLEVLIKRDNTLSEEIIKIVHLGFLSIIQI
ncbi:hypothetical protein L2E82_10775 [Cichorium intybus]|uniref:Uncharacterized protein n=1 Tax=Cichorium intybus TaxID=13427 RepID=A0ACB9GBG5_CICIN|nr:hypothetical protein L2E82_10775 [Cichorium intybus]